MSQITLQDLHFTYDGDDIPVFEGLNLQLDTNWRLGLVGRNGRGKTTLLRLLAGELEGRGTVSLHQPCRLWPGPAPSPERRTMDILLEGVPPEEEWRLSWELSKLGLREEVLERPFASLSGGEQTRALLAALFLDEGAYPLIDEPTNHLDGPGRALVAGYLRGLDRGFLLVSHDRAFLDGCTDHILALNRSGPELVRGNFSSWFQNKKARDRSEAARNEKLNGEIRRLEQAAAARKQKADAVERAKTGVSRSGTVKSGLRPYLGEKARKGQQQRKNIERRADRAVQEKSELLQDLERAERLKLAPLVYHSGRLLEARDLAAAYPGTAGRPVRFTLNQGDRLCLDGGNGSGKSSLLRLILGEEVPHTGTLIQAAGLVISYVPQGVERLRGDPAAWAEEQGLDRTKFLTLLRKLDFPRALFARDMGEYSAGQRKKALLAASLCRSAHLYIWDEPLNYIDLFSRMQLEELLLQYRPTLLFVEHDRMFQEKIASEVISL